ncbi:putative mitochondrial protein [Nicotiana attenuata]|uniref:Mitochondrial protein n=1 Tax=Nicotiana attenuata TaxID=49451 RepID=A0A314L831_NICAT|nr:putative mitochondrial protein [Nicotiana attenuata]
MKDRTPETHSPMVGSSYAQRVSMTAGGATSGGSVQQPVHTTAPLTPPSATDARGITFPPAPMQRNPQPPILPTPVGPAETGNQQLQVATAEAPKGKLMFPEFNGTDPRAWIRRCDRYFEIYKVPEPQKMTYIAMHLKDKVDNWFDAYIIDRGGIVDWPLFCMDICRRFGHIRPLDIIDEFSKLGQEGSIEAYQEKFEELRIHMMMINPHLNELHFVASFVSGLRPEIKHLRYYPGHQCKPKALNSMIGTNGAEQEEVYHDAREATEATDNVEEAMAVVEEEHAELSMNVALGMTTSPSTIKIQGKVKKLSILILVDSGSTHSFISPTVAKSMAGMRTMQGEEFHFPVRVLHFGGYDMVLGMNWLDQFSSVILNTRPLSVTFLNEGRIITLKGNTDSAEVWTDVEDNTAKLLQQGSSCCLVQLYELSQQTPEEKVPAPVLELLQKYADVFEEPLTLPPTRNCDHTITLLPDAHPFSLRPYRYSHDQKNAIEHMISEMLKVKTNQLYAKRSKCSFAQPQVDYLGHTISGNGVQTNPAKIQTMLQWPKPTSIKELRGFLGLTGYYRRFILGYGVISKPLTSLLKKGNFAWTEEATVAFERLKEAMVKAPVLALPDFSKPFTVEVDASGSVGDWVYLKLQHYRQSSVAIWKSLKLSSKFYGPYQVIRRIGNATYELQLPPSAKIHQIFHVSQLKKKIGTNIVACVDSPVCSPDGVPMTEPIAVLGRRMIKRGNKAVTQVLIQWSNLLPEEATWEDYGFIKSQFPNFEP